MQPRRFGSDEWLIALKEAINTSSNYRESAKTWEGDFWFVVEPEKDHPGLLIYLDLWHGECRAAQIARTEAEFDPEFRITATMRNWQRVIQGEIDPIRAILTNRLKLKGNLAKIMRNVRAAQALVLCATNVPTVFD